ncbi:unnamed protein product, partial [Amoebophrya sp. A25]
RGPQTVASGVRSHHRWHIFIIFTAYSLSGIKYKQRRNDAKYNYIKRGSSRTKFSKRTTRYRP